MGGGFRKKRGLAKIPGASADGGDGPPPVDRAAGAPPGASPGPRAVSGAESHAPPRTTPEVLARSPRGPRRASSAGHGAAACPGGQPAGKAVAGGWPNRPPRVSPRAVASPGRQTVSPGRQRPHLSPPGEALRAAMREAVRLELAEFFGPRGEPRARGERSWGSAVHDPMRSSRPSSAVHDPTRSEPVDTPLRSVGVAKVASSRCSGSVALGATDPSCPLKRADSVASADMESLPSETNHVHDHFKDFIQVNTQQASRSSNNSILRLIQHAEGGGWQVQQIVRVIDWMGELHEPPRSGMLADVVRSEIFERVVQVVILLNCAFMLIVANDEMANYESPSRSLGYVSIAFQMFFVVELCVKLCVHRLYFFWNHDAGFNTIDFFLVVSGLVDMVVSTLGSGSLALRTVRVLKIGKALRAVRVMGKFRNLRAILVCIQGSVDTLMWSVLMLCVVFYMFSLIFVQQAAGLLQDIHGDSELQEEHQTHVEYLIDNFGNVFQGMLTLSMAALGGEDWGVPYRSLEECGWVAAFFYLMFIAFTQIALINIITGIFVDSAMQNLAPGKETMARNLQLEKEAHSLELVNLCKEVDTNKNGMLKREEFQDGLKQGRLPMLLQLIGLNRNDVERFFDVLSASSPNGDVEITSFVHGCMRLSGAATSFDLQMLTVDLKGVQKEQGRDFRDVKRRLQRVERAMSEIVPPVCGGAASESMCMMDSLQVGDQYSEELDPV